MAVQEEAILIVGVKVVAMLMLAQAQTQKVMQA